jgi:NADH-quinone oxidoreductase subunit M
MFFFHSWLTIAHVEAPTIGSVILASLLLKLGGYGLIRFPITLLSLISQDLGPIIYSVGLLGFTYTSFCALRQFDLKRFIAYTSIAHMNLAIGGLFLLQENSYLGSVHTMISHGVIAAALFILVGFLYERTHVRNLSYFSGLGVIMPKFAVFFFLFMLANAGMPILSGFPGEFLTLLGIANTNYILLLPIALGFICTIAYTLLITMRILFGSPSTQFLPTAPNDLTLNEQRLLINLSFLTVALGVFPALVFSLLRATL